MNLKEINLNSNDERLLKFLARYKLMLGTDARYFYNSSYYQKRLQKLKNARYISRYNRIYIKLSNAGIRYLKNKEYRCENSCRKKAYIERLEFISKLGLELDKSNIPIKLSWEIKGTIYTNWSRRYIGVLYLNSKRYLLYNSKQNKKYIRAIHFEVNSEIDYENVLIFVDNFEVINKSNPFIFASKTSCVLVHKDDIDKLKLLEKRNLKCIIEDMYESELKDSDINIADYKVNNTNIIYMPFIDTHKIEAIKNLFDLYMEKYKIEIITLEKNIEVIKRLLGKNIVNVNIKELSQIIIDKILEIQIDNNVELNNFADMNDKDYYEDLEF